MLDFNKNEVTTILGTGKQGTDRKGISRVGLVLSRGGKPGKSQDIASPWDVVLSKDGTRLYIAMAGIHQVFLEDTTIIHHYQIWELDLMSGIATNFSGTGVEANLNSEDRKTAAW